MTLQIVLITIFISVIQHVACSCDFASFLQIPCYRFELTQKQCLEAGCCYNENEVDLRKCYKRLGNGRSHDMFEFNPTLVPESDAERKAEIEAALDNSDIFKTEYTEYFTDALLGIRRIGLSKVRLVCHATAKCPQNNNYINTKSSCHRQGCCYKNGECFQNAWFILKLCPTGSICKELCEKNNLCKSGTCNAMAESPGYRCTCPYGICGDNCERSDCFAFTVTTAVKPFAEALTLCQGTGTGGRMVSRVLGSDGSGYHTEITTTADGTTDDKYWVAIQGDNDKEQYLLTETQADAESGLVFDWNAAGVPDYPTAGEKCVYLDTTDNKLHTDSCSQEHYALCMHFD